ncbi:hypothetical protein JW851_02715 [Candidatus Woesearchaeota archaeon]|nr:hypothetical protein [Candidatus Woesearchaeota archaeon]
MNKIFLVLFSVFILILTINIVSASDVLVWQGQYYTGTTFNTGTYEFNFTVYDALTGGNICYSNTTSLTTGNWGEWKTEQSGVNSACNNVSKDYFLNINIGGADQTPRRRLVVWNSLRKDVDETTTGNLTTTGILDAGRFITPYHQIVTVAKSGADFTTIQGAIDSITDANATNRYAINVMPGDYVEAITMKDYADIVGSGRTNSRIVGTSGTVLTYPATKGTVSDMGIYVDYGTIGAESSAVVSGGDDSQMIRCDITVTKSAGDYQMHSFSITGGAYRMLDSYHYYSITGATTGTQLTQSAIEQSGALTKFLLYNSEITMTSDDTNDDLVGFETTTGGVGSYLVANNIITLNASGSSATATGLWLYGSASGATVAQNRFTVHGKSSAYGLWIESAGGGAIVNSRHNEIIITGTAAAESGHAGAGDTWNSAFDKITAKSGSSGTGIKTLVSSSQDGYFEVSKSLILGNGTTGAKTMSFNNGFLGNLSWNPTAAREIIIPDASGTMGVGTGSANQAVCWKTATTLGYCSDVVNSTGGCTCN